MSDSRSWWLPITVGVGAAAAVTAFQIMTRSQMDTSERHGIAEDAEEPKPLVPVETSQEQSPSKDVKPGPSFEELMDKAGITQFDEPVASAVVRDIINADTDPVLDESYCEVSSPKPSPIEKVDSAWRSWGWFFNP